MNDSNTPSTVEQLDITMASVLISNRAELTGRSYECCDIMRALAHGDIKTVDDLRAYLVKSADACVAEIRAAGDLLKRFGPVHLITTDEAKALRMYVVASPSELDSIVRWNDDKSGTDEWHRAAEHIAAFVERIKSETEY